MEGQCGILGYQDFEIYHRMCLRKRGGGVAYLGQVIDGFTGAGAADHLAWQGKYVSIHSARHRGGDRGGSGGIEV